MTIRVNILWLLPGVLLLLGFLLPAGASAVESPARGDSCMVVTAHPRATELGVRVLRQGGNAVDAAVAISCALAGVEPYSSGLGGGGFFVLWDAPNALAVSLDARETAPEKAHRDMFLQDGKASAVLSQDGPRSAGVPGLVAGLWVLHQEHGRLPWSYLVEAAAREVQTLEVSPMLRDRIAYHEDRFNAAAREVFLPSGRVPRVGDVLEQQDLARTLRAIAARGPEAFYQGPVAAALVQASRDSSGEGMTLRDLGEYRPRWREPVTGQYRGLNILSMAPPSSGGVHLVQMLNMLEPFDLRGMGFGSAAAVHHLAEVMKFAYADRSRFLGDRDFVDVPVDRLISRAHADSLRAYIRPERARPEAMIPGAPLLDLESHETTHFSVVDQDGSAVAATLTINLSFGSGRMAGGTGVLLNNEMDDFVAAPGSPNAFGLVGGEANAIAPGKRPLSSMTPTIVLKDGRVFMVAGAPGGSKIITTTLQNILNVVDHGMDALQAVTAARVHHQWFPRVLYLEAYGLSPDTMAELRRRGTLCSRVVPWATPRSSCAMIGTAVGPGPATRAAWVWPPDSETEQLEPTALVLPHYQPAADPARARVGR